MANDCYFDIYFRGKRGNVMLLCDSVATYHGTELLYAAGTDELYEAHIQGVCAWTVNYNVAYDWFGAEVAQDLNKLSASELRKLAEQCTKYSLREKSRVLQCDVMVRHWSEESGFDHFEYFTNGRSIKRRLIKYTPDNKFDWNIMEYVNHEGEYDNSISGNEFCYVSFGTNSDLEEPLLDIIKHNLTLPQDWDTNEGLITDSDRDPDKPFIDCIDYSNVFDCIAKCSNLIRFMMETDFKMTLTVVSQSINAGNLGFSFLLPQDLFFAACTEGTTKLTYIIKEDLDYNAICDFSSHDISNPLGTANLGEIKVKLILSLYYITQYVVFSQKPYAIFFAKETEFPGNFNMGLIVGWEWNGSTHAFHIISNYASTDDTSEIRKKHAIMLEFAKRIKINGKALDVGNLTADTLMQQLFPVRTEPVKKCQSPSIIGKEDTSLSFNHSLDNIANSNAHGPIIDSIRADRQLYLERQENEAKLRQEWKKKYSSYISEHPSIIVSEKKFVFVGYSAFNEKEDPFVKRVVENGGLYRSKVSGVTDYLVIGNGLTGESKIKAAIEQQKAGKPIQIIRQQALEDFLDGKAPSDDDDDADETPFTDDVVADETPLADDDAALDTDDAPLTAEDIASISPEARKDILELTEKMRSMNAQTRENAQRYADVKSMQEKMQQEKEQDLQKARENARIDPETDEACMFITLSNITALSMEQEYQTAEDFFESFGEDYPAYDQAALWQLRNQVQEKMKNADNRQTYIHRFMQLPVEDRFAWTTRSCFDIAYIFDVGEKYEKAISIGQKWITSTEMPEFQRLCQQHMDTMRESLRSQFATLCEDWLYWPRAKALLYVEYHNTPSTYDDTTLSCTVGDKVVTLCLRSSEAAFAELATRVLNYYAWFWGVPINEIWLTAYKNRFDANGRPLQSQYVENVDDRSDNTSLYLCQALDSLDIDYSSAPSSSIGMRNSGTASYRMSAVPDEAPAPVRKKEGCYIATAVYGSYDAPQVLTLRRFRDERLKKTALGRLFIRVYYRLSPPAAARLRNARHVNRLVRRCLDRWVQHLEQRQ